MENVSRRAVVKATAMGTAALAAGASAALASEAQPEAQQPKKIMVLLGSGQRDGNTGKLVDSFASGATDAGHEVTIFHLADMEINTCLGCGHCRQGDGTCVFDDDMSQIYDAYRESDMIVYASPVRYWMFNGVLKTTIERFYSLAYESEGEYAADSKYRTSQYPHDVHELYGTKDAALLLTSADNGWYTYTWTKQYWETCLVNFFSYNNKGVLLADACGEFGFGGSKKHIEDTGHLEEAYEFGYNIYAPTPELVENTAVLSNNYIMK